MPMKKEDPVAGEIDIVYQENEPFWSKIYPKSLFLFRDVHLDF